VIIGNDVYIGYNVTILSGVTIGDGAVVGACSVLTEDVPPYAIVAGNPARLIRYRFKEESIQKLLKIRWWDWPEERVKKNIHLICSNSVDALLKENS
jgi:serine acetyltransferase